MPASSPPVFHLLPSPSLLSALGDKRPFVLLETGRPSPGEELSFLFIDPLEIVTAREGKALESALSRLEEAGGEGLWAAGYMTYELGAFLEKALAPRAPGRLPLLWFGLFREPFVFDHRRGAFSPPLPFRLGGSSPESGPPPVPLGFSLDRQSYRRAVGRIQERIAAGDTYQVNFAMKYRFRHGGTAASLYLSMRDSQPVPYAAFIGQGERDVLSASPELFFRRDGAEILLRPMKGTSKRGRTAEEDALCAARLAADPKNRAENVMIVDLVRNDLGRVCLPGTVVPEELFRVEAYDTLLQLTSTVRGRLLPGCRLPELLRALFPCGSVTGAPKISTMKIIAELEPEARGVFCGAIGYLAPGGRATFSVPIRTVTLEGERGEMGVGSGIVADSLAESEYEECLLKSRFLTDPRPPLQLLETIGWQRREGFFFLDGHLERLSRSAAYFGFPYEQAVVRRLLEREVEALEGEGVYRVRLLLSRGGDAEACAEAVPSPASLTVKLSAAATDSSDHFLYHKTTRREVYERELDAARREGHFEVLFTNERGELTEGSFTNLFLQRGGMLHTPPVTCGLLDGILRRRLMSTMSGLLEECLLYPEDLEEAERILVGNSVRGLVEVRFAPSGNRLPVSGSLRGGQRLQ